MATFLDPIIAFSNTNFVSSILLILTIVLFHFMLFYDLCLDFFQKRYRDKEEYAQAPLQALKGGIAVVVGLAVFYGILYFMHEEWALDCAFFVNFMITIYGSYCKVKRSATVIIKNNEESFTKGGEDGKYDFEAI